MEKNKKKNQLPFCLTLFSFSKKPSSSNKHLMPTTKVIM